MKSCLIQCVLCICLLFGSHHVLAKNNIITLTSDQKKLTLIVTAMPTTGFVWSIKSFNKEIFSFEGSEYLKSKNKTLIGAPIQEAFNFKIITPLMNKSTIQLSLSRSWESKEVKVNTYTISVKK